ncbi:hypothetical protein GOP47_0020536 [Adiantum capillus-veneris]|uniref:Poly(A) RNA polymerase mitochondrial-like central palm domain-containing protein n=1 Tax=Adiantum capillus-veneris TaxID=13818 RepID=A0A9D4Z8S7_ADICA|nr:hypothetical protein GOP47_0020536 [Adiantum capillus-veneris]
MSVATKQGERSGLMQADKPCDYGKCINCKFLALGTCKDHSFGEGVFDRMWRLVGYCTASMEILAGASNFRQVFDLAIHMINQDSEAFPAIMDGESQIALEFEFGIVGEDLELSDDESLSSQVATQASKVENQVLQEVNFSSWREDKLGQFQNFLKELLRELQPKNEDHLARLNIVARLASVLCLMNSFRGSTLSTFGSFESNLYTRWADLDLSLELPDRSTLLQPISKKVKVKILNALSKTLARKGEARKVQFIPYARVPLITFEDSQHSISCDVSVDNDTAIVKSRMLRWLCEVDSRCRDLIFLVKFWAKAHDINDPKLGTLNSFALCLLVIFHLQTRSPPVLPPLSSVLNEDTGKQLKGCANLTEEVSKDCWEKIQPFIGNKFGAQNKSSVAELFTTFINQFSAVKDFWSQGLAVCTLNGAWIDRSSTCGKWRSKRYMMAIEDPFDRSENCARSVHHKTFNSIVKAFTSTAEAISRPEIDIGMPSLLESLFLWPADKQALGLESWLSKVLSKDEKRRHERLKFRTEQAAQYHRCQNANSKVVSLDILVNNTFEAQFHDQLQLENSRPPILKKKKRKNKKFPRAGPTATVGGGLGVNGPESESKEQNNQYPKKMVRNSNKTWATRKLASVREGISPAVVDRRGAAEYGSLSKTYAENDLLQVRQNIRQTADSNPITPGGELLVEGSRTPNPTDHKVPQSSMTLGNSDVTCFHEACPANEMSSKDGVAMPMSAGSSSLTIPQSPNTFIERKSYASVSKNINRQGSKFRKGWPTSSSNVGPPKLGQDIIVRNEGAIEPLTIKGADQKVVQGAKRFESRKVYPQAQVWKPRKMDGNVSNLSSASEGQRTSSKYEDSEPLPRPEGDDRCIRPSPLDVSRGMKEESRGIDESKHPLKNQLYSKNAI